jgi:hypothetical protein
MSTALDNVSTAQVLVGVGVVTTLSAPAAALAGDQMSEAIDSVAPGTHVVDATVMPTTMRSFAHDQLVKRTVRLARIEAHLRGKHLPRHYARHIRHESSARLMKRERALLRRISRLEAARRSNAATPSATAASASSTDTGGVDPGMAATLARIAQCESSGNPAAIGGGGLYRGAYQFDQHTWESVGGHGDPAAAPMAEQTRRAAILYSRTGPSSWPVCGR